MIKLCRAIAYYLPQFHPIPDNDLWWGTGFTEWTNTAKAKPLFPGHYQPHVPADLGFYDLRVPETRIAQAEMAREYGIEGFCYYHYWFAGKRLLERPFDEVLKSGEPDFPFCLCWANETWTGKWHGCPDRILIEQTYLGKEDEERHFYTLLPAFTDHRYMKIDGKVIYLVYNPEMLPDPKRLTDYWRELAAKNGLNGLYLIGVANEPWKPEDYGFDAATAKKPFHASALGQMRFTRKLRRMHRRLLKYPTEIYSYSKILPFILSPRADQVNVYPCVIPNWDNTPRAGLQGVVFHDSKPELFRKHLQTALNVIANKPFEHRILFIKSWNEWAEGNHIEPDLKFGKAFLEVVRDTICEI
jgi:lipopolysaccharide biosynthesis protein